MHMQRLIPVLSAVAALAVVATWTLHLCAAQPTGVDDLLRQRLEAAQEGAKLAQNMYQSGMGDFQAVSTWQRRVISSELAMARTKEQRVAAMQKEVDRAKAAEELAKQRAAAGLAPALDSMAAKYERLDAEAALAAEQQQP